MVWEKTGAITKPKTFRESQARRYCRGQSSRPAQEQRPVSADEGPRGSLEGSAGRVNPDDVLMVVYNGLNIIHVAEGCLP
jgi:hypothetical protein